MLKTLKRLEESKEIFPPSWLIDNIQFLAITGSHSYGVNEGQSDLDIVGFCTPPLRYIFPHVDGYIHDFSTDIPSFHQFQKHDIKDKDKDRVLDVSVYNIVRSFRLWMDNNPNMVDVLFSPQDCILHTSQVGQLVRDNRKLFLSKKCWHTFKGYAFSQIKKAGSTGRVGKRKETVDRLGYDPKFLYHLYRLIDEVEQILTLGDIDLRRSREQMKMVRRGEVTLDEAREYFTVKEKMLEQAYHDTFLPRSAPEEKIKELLLNCLEIHYGSLDRMISRNKTDAEKTLQQIKELVS